MDSTIKSNATVGPPIELLVYPTDSFSSDHYLCMNEDDEYLRKIRLSWNELLQQSFEKLPGLTWQHEENQKSADILTINTDQAT